MVYLCRENRIETGSSRDTRAAGRSQDMRKTRIASLILAVVMIAGLLPFGVFSAKAEEPAHTAPVIEKPVYVTVTDETGTPKAGATVQVLDSEGTVVETVTNADETFTVFLPAGTYTLKITDAPEGFLPPAEDATITVELTEAEEKDNLVGETVPAEYGNPLYEPYCIGHGGTYRDRIESYFIHDEGESVRAYCFNQNYDAPDPADEDAVFKRLVGTPELLYEIAQNKWKGYDGTHEMTPQELYDHVVSIIYHRDYIKNKYGFDDHITDLVMAIAIKQYTDGNLDSLRTNDEDGNNMVKRSSEDGTTGSIVYDENGNYQWRPGGSYLGSCVAHGMNEPGHKNNPDYVFPQEFKDAWHELIEMTDHPDDYYLYIYYPKVFHDRDYWRAWSEENYPGAIAHYANLYYANDPQCMLSTFTVEPIRTTLKLRTLTEIEITKTWADENDQDGCRPTADEYTAMVQLYADGTDVTETYKDNRTVTDNGDNTYTVKFTELPKYDESDSEITYKIKEDPVAKYTADKTEAGNGETITNRHDVELIDIPVEKEWKDGKNADGVRPEKITVRLLADGVEIKVAEITPDADGNWKYTFKDLPKYKDHGTKIKYTISEDEVPEYTTEIDQGTYKITNTHGPETVEKTVTKEWVDEANVDGVRPEKITVHLLADGKEVDSAEITPDADGIWSYTFTDLPKNREGGGEIVYTVTEDPVPEYEAEYDSLHITNKHDRITIEIPVEKKWDDANNQDGKRPEKITVRLLADGVEIDSAEVKPDANGNWSYTFKDLPKYKEQGVEIKYTITEDEVPEYETTIEGYVITNKHVPEETTIEGKKTWVEANVDPDEVRPVKITIRLFADGKELDAKTVTAKDGWKWKWEKLPKYKDGKEIKYTIKEDRVKNYLTKVEGFDVTNTFTPGTGDTMQPWMWLALLGLALLAGGGLLALEWINNKRTA